jgi:signal transduction histidine kinase
MPTTSKVVLLNVDDNAPMRYAKSRILKAAGFDVHEATAGMEALRLAEDLRPRLILLDVKLPDISGIEICRRLKAHPALRKIIVLQTSATFVEGSDRVRALDGGADSYLIEPTEPDELVANVRALLRLQDAEEKARENERLLRLATNAAGLDTWNVNLARKETISVEQFLSKSRLPHPSEPTQTREVYRIHTAEHDRLEQAFREALQGNTDFNVEYQMVGPSGAVRWIAAQASVLRDDDGHPFQVIGVAHDVTARKSADTEREMLLQQARRAQAEAEEATQLKDEFLATLSHELRTPLNAIIGWIQLLRTRRMDEPNTERALESIERNAQAQSQLINDLLDVSRIISGKLRLDVRPVAIASVVDAAIDTVRPAAQAKGIRLKAAYDSASGLMNADPERLQQVIWNLLTNAVKFSPNGGEVEVRVHRLGSHVEISVSDTGIGIHPDFLPFVFQPFRQAEAGSTRKHPGLGLGLAIVRQLVELHGGEVSAHSQGEAKGSTFRVRLPVDQPASPRAEVSALVDTIDDTDLSGIDVLVVDDDKDARDIIVAALAGAGATARAAQNVPEAWSRFEERLPDVLISDIGMPVEDGFALIHQLRRRASDKGGGVPAIALTAYARSQDHLRALDAGFQAHMAKPVKTGDLVRAVASLAGKSVAGG